MLKAFFFISGVRVIKAAVDSKDLIQEQSLGEKAQCLYFGWLFASSREDEVGVGCVLQYQLAVIDMLWGVGRNRARRGTRTTSWSGTFWVNKAFSC